jgi:hypothetical protein
VRHGDAAPVSMVELVQRAGAEGDAGGKKKPRQRRDQGKGTRGPAEPRRRAAAG